MFLVYNKFFFFRLCKSSTVSCCYRNSTIFLFANEHLDRIGATLLSELSDQSESNIQ